VDLSRTEYEALERLFEEAQALGADGRRDLVARVEPRLRAHLARLLDAEGGDVFTEAAIEEQRAQLDAVLDLDLADPESIGPFRILRRIGEGGMGTVFEARQSRPDRRVALKVLRTALASADRVARFEREGEWLGRLHHPGIAQVFEVGVFELGRGRQPYLAMEFVEGTDLITHAAREHLLLRQRVELLARVAEAVEHAHGAGVLHRDLKPDNVLVDAFGQPKLVDFGISRSLAEDGMLGETLTADGQILGTLGYMAPEQLDPSVGALGPETDVFALGLLGFELLTGRRAIVPTGTSPSEVLAALATSEPPSPASVDPALRGDIDTILSKAMAREPMRRYRSAGALAADLWRHLDDRPIRARPASAAYRVSKFVRRERALVRVLAVLVLGLVGTIGFAVDAARKGERAVLAAERERASSAELGRTLYAAESRLASAAATEAGGIGIVARHVERWSGRAGAGEVPGWELRWLANLASSPGAALPVRGPMYAIVEDRARERFVHVGTHDIVLESLDGAGTPRVLAGADLTPIDAAVSADGRLLATTFVGGSMEVRELEGGNVVWSGQPVREPRHVVWHPGTDTLVCNGFDGRTHGLDPRTGEVRWTEEASDGGRTVGVRMSADGERLALVQDMDLVIAEVGPFGTLVVMRFALPAAAATHDWSPDGHAVAFGTVSGHVGIMELGDGGVRFLERPNGHRVTDVAFSRDGALVAAASYDDSVAIVDARLGRLVRRIRFDTVNQQAVAWADDARLSVLGDQPVVTAWDLRVPSAIDRGWLTPDPLRYATVTLERSDAAGTFDVSIGQSLRRFRAVESLPRAADGAEQGHAIARTSDGRGVARLADGALTVDVPGSAAPLRFDVDISMRARLEWSRGAAPRLVLGDMLSLWVLDPADGRGLRRLHSSSPTHPTPTWSADGDSILFSAPTQHVRRIDPGTGEVLAEVDVGREALSLALSPDGEHLAVGTSANDVFVLDAETLEILRTLDGHTEEVRGVAWSPDGRRLASGGHDRRVRVWDPARGELMAAIDVGKRIGDLEWSVDGRDLLVVLVTGDIVRLSSGDALTEGTDG